jgi:hypothetical protein
LSSAQRRSRDEDGRRLLIGISAIAVNLRATALDRIERPLNPQRGRLGKVGVRPSVVVEVGVEWR